VLKRIASLFKVKEKPVANKVCQVDRLSDDEFLKELVDLYLKKSINDFREIYKINPMLATYVAHAEGFIQNYLQIQAKAAAFIESKFLNMGDIH
jgi:hypothetical protein